MCWILIWQMVFLPVAFSASPRTSHAHPTTSRGDAFLDSLADVPQPRFNIGDDILDHDPFFLRSQAWVNATTAERPGTALIEANGYTLQITQPLSYIGETETYFILSAEAGFADGVFLIDRLEFASSAAENNPVGVYFFPLPGEGWDEAEAFPIAHLNTVVLKAADGDTLPILEDDLDRIVSVARMNLFLAQTRVFAESGFAQILAPLTDEALAISRDLEAASRAQVSHPTNLTEVFSRFQALSQQAMEQLGRTFIFPAPGSTAAFGLVYTDLDTRERTHSLLRKVIEFLSPKSAYAIGPLSEGSKTKSLKSQLTRFAIISGAALVGSVVLKYTVFRNQFEKRRACEAALAIKNNSRWHRFSRAGIGREIREIGDVYAHTLTTLYQAPSVWFGNAVEFVGDRFFPQVFSGRNKLVRKILDKTVYFVRDTNARVPVNHYTYYLGTVILGGVDTILYYLQLYHVVPSLARSLAEKIPALRSRIEHAYDVDNPHTPELNRIAVASCAVSYGTSGASHVSQDIQNQMLTPVRAQVDEAMRRDGLDPDNVQNESERERRIRQRLDLAMRQAGLPGPSEFLFDAASLNAGLYRLLGYSNPNAPENETFIGEKRPGLIAPSVARALTMAKDRLEYESQAGADTAGLEGAVKILENAKREFSFFQSFLKNPRDVRGTLARFRKIREEFVALTYEDPTGSLVKNAPGSWVDQHGREAAELAASLFRRSMLSYLSGSREGLWPSKAERERYSEVVRSRADQALITSHKSEFDELRNRGGLTKEVALAGLIRKYPAEHSLHIDEQIAKHLFERDEEAAGRGSYKPPKRDFVARWQLKRIERIAHERQLKDPGRPFNELYAAAMMDVVGLHPDYDAPDAQSLNLREVVAQKANQATENELRANSKLKAYVDELDPAARAQFLAQLYANNAVQSYVQLTTASETLSQLSPAQPGRTQRIRQMAAVRHSQALTRIARAVDAAYGDVNHSLGLRALIDRVVPGWADFTLANSRTYRAALTWGTVGVAVSAGLWGITITPQLWALGLITRFTVAAPSQYLTRLFRVQEIKPMGSVITMVGFAFIFSWATFWGSIPQQIFAQDFFNLWDSTWAAVQEPFRLLAEWLTHRLRE